jgi:DNA (cytosine-5)-methyltransferase 1
MKKPLRLLDLFCGAGGCSAGYVRAGFTVMGVDKNPMPRYPYPFIQEDALVFLEKYGHQFDVIHASPPCQKYSRTRGLSRKETQVDLLPGTRILLEKIGKPYIIENVPFSPMRPDVILNGKMFGLRVLRDRWFELGNGIWIMSPGLPAVYGTVKNGDFVSVYGNGSLTSKESNGGLPPNFTELHSIKHIWQYAMGIDWMTVKELAQAIPPAYTEYIGKQIYDQIKKAP